MKKILLIGNTCVDVIINIDHLNKTAEDIQPTSQTLALGGCPFNVSNIVRQSGVPFLFITPVGTGIYGDFVRRELTRLGFPIPVRSEAENGCCYCLVEAGGERTFLSYHGVEYTFSQEWMKDIDINEISMIYICGFEIEEPTGVEIISWLENHPGPEIFFAPGPRLLMIDSEKKDRLFRLHPILHINEQEAYDLSGSSDLNEAAEILRSQTGNTVLITLGERGSCCLEKDAAHLLFAEGIPTPVTDTIGAGDSHIGQILASRAKGRSWIDALRDANCVSSRVVSVQGASLTDEQYRQCLSVASDLSNV